MDADIRRGTEKVNDFDSFFLNHTDVLQVCFNGQKAAQMFRNLVRLDSATAAWKIQVLPSTSPAYASMPYSEKLKLWRKAIIDA
jgi:TDG/mug DNA glycosylase family protein